MAEITQDRLKAVLRYNRRRGVFTWLRRPEDDFSSRKEFLRYHSVHAGKVAGSFDGRYLVIKIDGHREGVHRLAWLYVHGYLPKEVDHKNRNKLDNRFSNLREASRQLNACNIGITSRNTSGVKGVHWFRGKWRAQVRIKNKNHWLGDFDTVAEAATVRRKGAAKLHGEFVNHG
jgi:hypothetical protein